MAIQNKLLFALLSMGLLWVALLNGYPLIYYDTGTYLHTAVARYSAPVDRPVIYGWFIYLTSLNISPWLTVIGQAVIALLIMQRLLTALDLMSNRLILIGSICVTTLLSSGPYFFGQLMPDFFSGLLPLALFLLIGCFKQLARWERMALTLFIFFGVGSHLSHVIIVTVAVIVSGAFGIWRARSTQQMDDLKACIKGIGLIITAIALAITAVSSTNYIKYSKFVLSPGSHVFLMGRLLADGPASDYLKHACPQAGYKLCHYLGELPNSENEYVWTGPLLDKTGSWIGSYDESWKIIKATITEYPAAIIWNALTAWGRQLATIGVTENLTPMDKGASADRIIASLYPDDIEKFWSSLQQLHMLKSSPFLIHSQLQSIAFWIFLFIGLVLSWREFKHNPSVMYLYGTCVTYLVINALVCGALSGVSDRYQSRVTWPIIFVSSALLFRFCFKER